MTIYLVRRARQALAAGPVTLLLMHGPAFATATAQTPSIEGNWLFAAGAVFLAVVALWLTCIGALRSDRRDRTRATSGTDRGGPVYTDVDGYMRVH